MPESVPSHIAIGIASEIRRTNRGLAAVAQVSLFV
jgi:hypothetical protein